jgi:hypothetical protein
MNVYVLNVTYDTIVVKVNTKTLQCEQMNVCVNVTYMTIVLKVNRKNLE